MGSPGATRRASRVAKTAPFDRPFLQELYGIHNTFDLSENEAVVPHENRLLERSTFHSNLPSGPPLERLREHQSRRPSGNSRKQILHRHAIQASLAKGG
jgi:hypothetical protein